MARTFLRRLAPPVVVLALLTGTIAGWGAGAAGAESRWFSVRLADGEVVAVEFDVAPGTPVEQIPLPGELIEELPPPPQPEPVGPEAVEPVAGGRADDHAAGDDPAPRSRGRRSQRSSGSDRAAGEPARRAKRDARVEAEPRRRAAGSPRPRRPDSAPAPSAPGYFDALPGPSASASVPDFAIRKFRVPIFLLPIYQAAGTQYGIRWEYLAAINEIETDYGRNLNVSSAGALGWMQFMPATWRQYGVDANRDGRKDPYNPVDAIFSSARYLKAAGAPRDMRRAIFAYNHADWYVDSVVLRARLIAGLPSDLIGSLTGLTDGRFPVAARARYSDRARKRRGRERDRGIDIFTRRGAPAIAVNDGVVKRIGSRRGGAPFVVLQDAYGNRFTYRGLDSVSRWYRVPRGDAGRGSLALAQVAAEPSPEAAVAKRRLFAHPGRAAPRRNGGTDQLMDAGGFDTYRNLFTRGPAPAARDARRRRLRPGARVTAGTILGRVGSGTRARAARLRFEVRPAGRGAPSIDPKPILDGWKLLESTAVFRASGRNVLYGDDARGVSIGQIMLLPKPMLERRVLSDERIDIYPCGRRDVRTGQVDRRVLATLAYLAESGLRPGVSSLRCGHGFYTASGNVSQHSSGNAVDISRINGVPVLGHQERGGITEQTVERLMRMQGTMRPDQIISLLDRGANSLAMSDHDDHVHVGWRPLFGANRRLGRQTLAVLRPGQWHDLVGRLRAIDQPAVALRPSRYSVPARKPSRRASRAHAGE